MVSAAKAKKIDGSRACRRSLIAADDFSGTTPEVDSVLRASWLVAGKWVSGSAPEKFVLLISAAGARCQETRTAGNKSVRCPTN
jgi:hypothetical protein